MKHCLRLLVAMGLALCVPAGAQSLAIPSSAASQPVTTLPPAADFERALQQADGPRRRILEATRPKAARAEPPPVAAPQPARARVEPALAPLPRPVVAAAPPRAPEPPPAVATLQATVPPLSAPTGGLQAVQPLPAPELAAEPQALAVLPERAPSQAQGAPQLLSRVDPVLPARWLRRSTGRTEVQVAFTVQADGSVADVDVRSPVATDLATAVADALRQWRYEAQPAARRHSVVLVIAPG